MFDDYGRQLLKSGIIEAKAGQKNPIDSLLGKSVLKLAAVQ